MLEAPFQAALLAAIVRLPGVRAWRQQAGKVRVRGGWMQLSPAGAGDIVGTVAPDGLHFEIETKGSSTPTQRSQDPWAVATMESGAVYVRARVLRGESVQQAVARAVRDLLAAIEEARSRRACAAAEAKVAARVAANGVDR